MLRRLLITWLIVSILGYGMAVAADVHNELSPEQAHAIGDHAPNPIDLDDSINCDHCCHGVIHLFGLISAEAQGLTADRSFPLTPYFISLTTISPTSPLRPPIAV